MQVRIGKKGCIKRAWWSSGYSTARFFFLTLVLIGLEGCATKKIKDPTVIKAIDSICLTSQGKGRIEYSGGRHVFNYESLWQPSDNKWSLAFGLPLIGEELLVFHLAKNDSKSGVSGTFATRLKNEIKSKKMKFLLNAFYKNLSELLVILKDRRVSRGDSPWHIYLEDNDFIATSNIGDRYVFKLRAFEWDAMYKRLTMSLSEKSKEKPLRRLLGLELFISSCDLN
ncbi:MAG: hypothetical protein K9K67_04840 [Bacteriovoracaceae bacterium]|nr:hypothetical protein [Bacteriovoracaceae bacterium]